jgi:hypothetical protein
MCDYGCDVSVLSDGSGAGPKTAGSCALAGRFVCLVQMFDRLEESWKT